MKKMTLIFTTFCLTIVLVFAAAPASAAAEKSPAVPTAMPTTQALPFTYQCR